MQCNIIFYYFRYTISSYPTLHWLVLLACIPITSFSYTFARGIRERTRIRDVSVSITRTIRQLSLFLVSVIFKFHMKQSNDHIHTVGAEPIKNIEFIRYGFPDATPRATVCDATQTQLESSPRKSLRKRAMVRLNESQSA